jgi:hypothetical protein
MNPSDIQSLIGAEQARSNAEALANKHEQAADYYERAAKREAEKGRKARADLQAKEKALADLQAKLGQPPSQQLAKKAG